MGAPSGPLTQGPRRKGPEGPEGSSEARQKDTSTYQHVGKRCRRPLALSCWQSAHGRGRGVRHERHRPPGRLHPVRQAGPGRVRGERRCFPCRSHQLGNQRLQCRRAQYGRQPLLSGVVEDTTGLVAREGPYRAWRAATRAWEEQAQTMPTIGKQSILYKLMKELACSLGGPKAVLAMTALGQAPLSRF